MADTSEWSRASLRIFSVTLSVHEISELLSALPTYSYEKDSPVSSRSPEGAKRNMHAWFYETGSGEALPLEERLEILVSFLEEKSIPLRDLMKECEVDIFCGFFTEHVQGGFTLSATLLKRLTVFPIDVAFDLYPLDSGKQSEG